ncbi:UDP-diphosphatase, partial [Gammaproteobacteria bacterium]|nr:UDP-diphosphatase [Gammaproteobacteria bacterium]
MTDYFLSFLLGIIQGLTEFLPISSSAHLLFPTLIFGTNDLGLSFDIAVHAGTLIAVISYFRLEIIYMLKSISSNDVTLSDYRKLTYMLIIATIPIVAVGLGFSDFIDARIFNISSIAIANLIFAIVLLIVFLNRKENVAIFEITLKAALVIGIFQCLALIPGAS